MPLEARLRRCRPPDILPSEMPLDRTVHPSGLGDLEVTHVTVLFALAAMLQNILVAIGRTCNLPPFPGGCQPRLNGA